MATKSLGDLSQQLDVFLAYRSEDGLESAAWLYGLLQNVSASEMTEVGTDEAETARFKIFWDQCNPAGLRDFRHRNEPALHTAQAFILVVTEKAAVKRSHNDWLYREIEWWVRYRRTIPPLIVEMTGEGDQWIPSLIKIRYPNLQRVNVNLNGLRALEDDKRLREEQRIAQQLIDGIFQRHERFKDWEQNRLRWQRIILLGLLLLMTLLTGVATRFWNDSRWRLINQITSRGVSQMEKGDLLGSLPFLSESLRQQEQFPWLPFRDKPREHIHRMRLAAIQWFLPALTHQVVVGNDIARVEFYGGGEEVLVLDQNGSLTHWSLTDGLTTPLEQQLVASHGTEREFNRPLMSPDQRYWVVSRPGFPSVVVERPTGEHVLELNMGQYFGFPCEPTLIAFSPDSTLLACSTFDDTKVWLWDIANARQLGEPLEHSLEVGDIAFSSDGQWLKTDVKPSILNVPPPPLNGAPQDVTDNTTIWNIATGAKHRTCRGFGISKLSPDGQHVALGDNRGRITLVSIDTGDITSWAQPGFSPSDIAFTSDGATLAVAGSSSFGEMGEVRVYRLLQDPNVPPHVALITSYPVGRVMFHDAPIHFARISPDDKFILTASGRDYEYGEVRIWDLDTGLPITPPLPHNSQVVSAEFDATGRRVVTAGRDGLIRVWDLAGMHPITRTTERPSTALDVNNVQYWSSDGVLLLTRNDDNWCIWDAAKGDWLATLKSDSEGIIAAHFSPNGEILLTISSGSDETQNTIRVFDVSKGTEVAWSPIPVRHHDDWNHMLLNDSGTRLVTMNRLDGKALLWHLDSSIGRTTDISTQSQDSRSLLKSVTDVSACFSADGKRVVVYGNILEQGVFTVWDAIDGTLLAHATVTDSTITTAALNASGTLFAVGCGRDVRVWDIKRGTWFDNNVYHGEVVKQLMFHTPDTVLAISGDKAVRLCNTTEGQRLSVPFVDGVDAGPRIISIARDLPLMMINNRRNGEQAIWDTVTGESLSPFRVKWATPGLDTVTWSIPEVDDSQFSWAAVRHEVHLLPDLRGTLEIESVSELMSGRRLDNSGALVPLTNTDLQRIWDSENGSRSLRRRISVKEIAAWHDRLAATLERRQHWKGAILHLSSLLAVSPSDPSIRVRRGSASVHLDEWHNAAEDLREAVAQGDRQWQTFHRLSQSLIELQEWSEAASAIENAEEYGGPGWLMQRNRSIVFSRQGMWDDAMSCLEHAVATGGDSFAAIHANLGIAHAELRDLNAAIAAFQKAVTLAPEDTTYKYWLAHAQLASNRLDECAWTFAQLLDSPDLDFVFDDVLRIASLVSDKDMSLEEFRGNFYSYADERFAERISAAHCRVILVGTAFRAGHYGIVEELTTEIEGLPLRDRIWCSLFRLMAMYDEERASEAMRLLEKSSEEIASFEDDRMSDWISRSELSRLLGEAQALVYNDGNRNTP